MATEPTETGPQAVCLRTAEIYCQGLHGGAEFAARPSLSFCCCVILGVPWFLYTKSSLCLHLHMQVCLCVSSLKKGISQTGIRDHTTIIGLSILAHTVKHVCPNKVTFIGPRGWEVNKSLGVGKAHFNSQSDPGRLSTSPPPKSLQLTVAIS